MKCIREIDPALLEPDGADRNDAVSLFRMQAGGLRIEDDEIGL